MAARPAACLIGWRNPAPRSPIARPALIPNRRLRSGEEWRSELALGGFADHGAAELEAGPWPISVIWGRTHPLIEVPAAERAVSRSISIIATGTNGSRALCEQLARAGHRASEAD